MLDSLSLAVAVVVAVSLSLVIGYSIARRSKRAGVAVASSGSVLAMIIVINYFIEVPVEIVAAGFLALAGSMFLALYDDAWRHSASATG